MSEWEFWIFVGKQTKRYFPSLNLKYPLVFQKAKKKKKVCCLHLMHLSRKKEEDPIQVIKHIQVLSKLGLSWSFCVIASRFFWIGATTLNIFKYLHRKTELLFASFLSCSCYLNSRPHVWRAMPWKMSISVRHFILLLFSDVLILPSCCSFFLFPLSPPLASWSPIWLYPQPTSKPWERGAVSPASLSSSPPLFPLLFLPTPLVHRCITFSG